MTEAHELRRGRLKKNHSKVMSLRLPADLAEELAAVARTDEVPISESIRTAIYEHITTRRSSPGFQARRKRLMERDREILEGLGAGSRSRRGPGAG